MIAAVFVHPVGQAGRTFDPSAISIEWADMSGEQPEPNSRSRPRRGFWL